MQNEVAVWWKDNHGSRKLYRNVGVQFFDPGTPKILHRAMIIRGDRAGQVYNVRLKVRGTNAFQLIDDKLHNAFYLDVHKKDLCRVADPELLTARELLPAA